MKAAMLGLCGFLLTLPCYTYAVVPSEVLASYALCDSLTHSPGMFTPAEGIQIGERCIRELYAVLEVLEAHTKVETHEVADNLRLRFWSQIRWLESRLPKLWPSQTDEEGRRKPMSWGELKDEYNRPSGRPLAEELSSLKSSYVELMNVCIQRMQAGED